MKRSPNPLLPVPLRRAAFVALGMVLLTAWPPGPPGRDAPPATDEEAVRRVASQLHGALASGDSARVLELLAEDVRVYESGHAESRAEYREGHLGIDIEFARDTERQILSERVRISGEDMALYLAEYRTTGTFRGEEIDGHGTETLVMERRPPGWRIVHIHWSSR